MLNEEAKAKLKSAIKSLGKVIDSLANTPVDPRALMLIDVAASYLEEQREKNVEYKEAMGAMELDDEEEYRILKDIDTDNVPAPPALPNIKPTQTLGDIISDDIQRWYASDESIDEEGE